jgi:hypothetical protein
MPAGPAARQIDFTINDSVSANVSPYTLSAQLQPWLGADWWGLNVSLPLMKRPQANLWIAWMAELRGKLNVFSIGDPLGAHPVGIPQGAPIIDCSSPGYNLPMATMLYTRGWKPGELRLLLPGDYLQVGYRLYMVSGVSPVNADATGHASFPIWPSIREMPTDGEPIILNKTTGLFRLADNQRQWTANYLKVYPLAFKCNEAR